MEFSSAFIKEIINLIENDSRLKNTDFFCTNRDIFQVRLDSYIYKTKAYLECAAIGEIGNNTFDHNWIFSEGKMRGAYFYPDYKQRYIILADFGCGIRKSLSAVKKINSDLEALQIAFTEHISGRAPEQRGNGLKFVCDTIKDKKHNMYFQSGNAYCIIENGSMEFKESEIPFEGCFSIMEFNK